MTSFDFRPMCSHSDSTRKIAATLWCSAMHNAHGALSKSGSCGLGGCTFKSARTFQTSFKRKQTYVDSAYATSS